MFTSKDLKQLASQGISEEQVIGQLKRFQTGFAPVDVVAPATTSNGIKILTNNEIKHYHEVISNARENGLSISKFVPASGAATRMFKDLFNYIDKPLPLNTLPGSHPVVQFIELLPRFPFFPFLATTLKEFNLNNEHTRAAKAVEIISTLLNHQNLNYGLLPKALVHFHNYPDAVRVAMEEHLFEGAQYAKGKDEIIKVHFTISPEHLALFNQKLNSVGPGIESLLGAVLDVSFSFQKPHTDTIAVTPDNNPFRDNQGNLLFRPGGHGALIENLNEQQSDIIFIKNIDNVVQHHLNESTTIYKKAIGGLLVDIRDKVYSSITELEKYGAKALPKVEDFINKQLLANLPSKFKEEPATNRVNYLKQYLNRPIRVCGMVKNVGEPGGGPFWVREKEGQLSLQILESSQFDLENPSQAAILKSATHFNPVDIVCSIKNYKGETFDLGKFTDPETGFISSKTYNGRNLKALELPGLWNGAMSNWITLFVEVPLETFNPVKTVNDLLRPQHQPA